MMTLDAEQSVVGEILAFNRDRDQDLVRIKLRRLVEDAFSLFRGTDHLFAAYWARLCPPDVGPSILICGDLHLENFGAYRTEDGDFLYDINDFDEALVAPCSLDLVRCLASILLASQVWRLTPVQAMRTVLVFLDRYRTTVAKSVRKGAAGELALGTARGPIWRLLRRPARGDPVSFLAHNTEKGSHGATRLERASGRFLPIGRRRRERLEEAIGPHVQRAGQGGSVEVLDIAFRVAGIGSLGLRRYAVLVRGVESPASVRLLDLKEARPSALLACTQDIQPGDGGSEALRVVRAQRHLQARPAAGLDVFAFDGRDYRLRELIPEENRTGLDELRKRPGRLRRAVAVAGRLTAWAHVRGSRFEGIDQADLLGRWADGPGLDAAIASAVRFAEQARRDLKILRRAVRKGLVRREDQ
jgi:uncharacterized protein (DUF2252 family)